MITFDTNYLVRHIVQDDPDQCRTVSQDIAREAVAGRTILILDIVLLETVWVLESIYGFDRKAVVSVLSELLEDSAFSFENPGRIKLSLDKFSSGKADYADYLIVAVAESKGLEIQTFDKKLRKELR